jgi:hypothetical protein
MFPMLPRKKKFRLFLMNRKNHLFLIYLMYPKIQRFPLHHLHLTFLTFPMFLPRNQRYR